MITTGLNKAGIPCYWLTKQPKTCRSENLEQKDLNFHCKQLWPDDYKSMFHCVNEHKGSAFYGGVLNDRGRKKGVADWQVQIPRKGYHGLIIELKKEIKSKSQLGKEQKEYLLRQQALGYQVAVCYGYKAALKVIEEYLN